MGTQRVCDIFSSVRTNYQSSAQFNFSLSKQVLRRLPNSVVFTSFVSFTVADVAQDHENHSCNAFSSKEDSVIKLPPAGAR